jgi:hypothetical protein
LTWNTTEGLSAGTARLGLIVLLVFVAQVAFGFAIGSWWGLLLPHALAVLAVPAQFPSSDQREPLPIWLVQAWLATPEAVLVIPGILARKLRDAEA